MSEKPVMKCPFCGKEFINESGSRSRIYCSTKCKRAANNKRRDRSKKATVKVDSYIPKHVLPPEIQRMRCAGSW